MLRRTLISASLLLAACATPAERAHDMEAEMDRLMTEFGPACERLGYTRGEDKWRECVLRFSAQMDPGYNRYHPVGNCYGNPWSWNCINY